MPPNYCASLLVWTSKGGVAEFVRTFRSRDNDPLDSSYGLERFAVQPRMFVDRRFLPAATSLEPEDCRDYGFPTFACRLTKQVLGNFRVRLRVSKVQFVPVMLAQRLWIDAYQAGDLRFWHAVAGESFDLSLKKSVGRVSWSRHQESLGARRRASLASRSRRSRSFWRSNRTKSRRMA